MVWETDEIRKIKVTIKRPLKQGQDLIVTFGVEGSQKVEFAKELMEYIEAVTTEEMAGQVNDVEEVFDAVTNEVVALNIEVIGMNQGLYVQEFQKRAPKFIANSKWQY